LAFLPYVPSLGGGFLWDDDTSVTASELVRDPGGWWKAWFSPPPSHPDYFPLTTTTFWLEWRLWGDHPAGYRVVNVLLHAAAVLGLRRLALALGVPGAWWAAAWFAVHPVNVESVAWIAERKNVLSLALAMPAFLAFLRWSVSRDPKTWRAALLWFAGALAAKASVVALPVVFLLWRWWHGPKPGWRDLVPLAPFLALSLGFGLLVIQFQHGRALGETEIVLPGWTGRLAGAATAFWFYLGKALWPVDLATIYPRWDLDPPHPGHLALAALTLGAGVALAFRRSPPARAAAFALGSYALLLAPALGLVKMSFMRHGLVADHFQHAALPALLCGAVSALVWASRRLPDHWLRLSRGLAATALAVLFALTWHRASLHGSHEALWSDAAEKNPASPQPQAMLGALRAQRGETEAAEAHFREALRLGSSDPRVLTNLGLTFVERGHLEEAQPWFEQAVATGTSYAPAHLNLARVRMQRGDTAGGLDGLRDSADRFPNNVALNSAAGAALLLASRPTEAISYLARWELLEPGNPDAKSSLAQALDAAGRPAEAHEKRRQARALGPSRR
jgi:Flp pilus assembly protein TadD